MIVYVADSNDWVRYHQVHSVHDDLTQKSMYIIRHSSSHFDIVLSIQLNSELWPGSACYVHAIFMVVFCVV